MFDIVIVGGNLAGATAAISSAEKGTNVVLIEKNKEPFFPPHCGELIPERTVEMFQLDKTDCISNIISSMVINLPSKEFVFKLKKQKMIMIDRYRLENQLLKKAETNGVKLRLGRKVVDFRPPSELVLNDKKTIKGKIIIDATGIACRVGNLIGINTRIRPEDIGVCIQSRVQGDFKQDTTNMWFHKPYAPLGYAWLFPINDNLANIGLIVPGGKQLDLSSMLKQYIEDMTKGKYKITSTFRSSVPLAPPLSRLFKDNVMFVGDAARLVHPDSGGGIDSALFSGNLAGRTAARFIHGDISSLEEYQNIMRIKILRLKNEYKRRAKAIESDVKFVNTYEGIFSLLSFFNRLFPNILNSNLLLNLEKISI